MQYIVRRFVRGEIRYVGWADRNPPDTTSHIGLARRFRDPSAASYWANRLGEDETGIKGEVITEAEATIGEVMAT